MEIIFIRPQSLLCDVGDCETVLKIAMKFRPRDLRSTRDESRDLRSTRDVSHDLKTVAPSGNTPDKWKLSGL